MFGLKPKGLDKVLKFIFNTSLSSKLDFLKIIIASFLTILLICTL